jgi:hypothetical protein
MIGAAEVSERIGFCHSDKTIQLSQRQIMSGKNNSCSAATTFKCAKKHHSAGFRSYND